MSALPSVMIERTKVVMSACPSTREEMSEAMTAYASPTSPPTASELMVGMSTAAPMAATMSAEMTTHSSILSTNPMLENNRDSEYLNSIFPLHPEFNRRFRRSYPSF